MRSWLVASSFALTLTSLGVPTAAQDVSEEIARRGLIADAEAASDQGDHARALQLATRASAIRMSPSLRLLIAQEHEALDQRLEAFDQAERCATEARSSPSLNQRDAIVEECDVVRGRVGARLARLTIERAPELRPAVAITLDGQPLAAALVGVALPSLPVTREVVATEAGFVSSRTTVTLEAGRAQTVWVRALVREAPPPLPSPRPVILPAERRPGPWIVSGFGLGLLALGGLLWWQRELAVGDCVVGEEEIRCPTQSDANRAMSASDWGTAAHVSAGVGLVALGAGALWLLLRPTSRTTVVPARSGLTVGVQF